MTEHPTREGAPRLGAPPRQHRSAMFIAIAAVLVAGSGLAALGASYLDRQDAASASENEPTREQLESRLERALSSQGRLEAKVERLERRAAAAGTADPACRRAVRAALKMWDASVEAFEAIADDDAEAFQGLAERADRARASVLDGLEACGVEA